MNVRVEGMEGNIIMFWVDDQAGDAFVQDEKVIDPELCEGPFRLRDKSEVQKKLQEWYDNREDEDNATRTTK